MDVDRLKTIFPGMSETSRAVNVERLKEIQGILEMKPEEMDPEQKKVYDRFKGKEDAIAELIALDDRLTAGTKGMDFARSNIRNVTPYRMPQKPRIDLVPLQGGKIWAENDVKLSAHVLSKFSDPKSKKYADAEENGQQAVLCLATAYALAVNPYASQKDSKVAATELGNALDKIPKDKQSAFDKEIIKRLKSGDIEAVKELVDGGSDLGTNLMRVLRDSNIIVYDGTAITRFRTETIFRMQLSDKGLDPALREVGDAPSFDLLSIFLGLEYAHLNLGATKFGFVEGKGATTTKSVKDAEKFSATGGAEMEVDMFGIPSIITVSAEIGTTSIDGEKQLYVGVQSMDIVFPGEDTKKYPIRIEAAGVKHAGTDFEENYLAYAIVDYAALRGGSTYFDFRVNPYITNFFGLVYGGAEVEAAMTIFPGAEKRGTIELSVGADASYGKNAMKEAEFNVDPKIAAKVDWGWGSFGMYGKYSDKYKNPKPKGILENADIGIEFELRF